MQTPHGSASKSFDTPACVIVKHANPCGVALGADAPLQAYSKAFKTRPTSAFGGIIALNCTLDGAAAREISKQFVEVLDGPRPTAPRRLPCSLPRPTSACRLRCPRQPTPPAAASQAAGAADWARGRNAIDMKRVGSGLLLQTADNHQLTLADLKVVTVRHQPSAAQLEDMMFAWKVAHVKSNAIRVLS